MKHIISEKTFFQFLKCPSWVYFDAFSDSPKPHDPLLAKMLDDSLIDEMKRHLIQERNDIAEVDAEDLEDRFRQTLEFMHEGRETIYGGVLIDAHWVGAPDILEKVEGQSKLGNHYYIAADMKKYPMREDYKFQGCFYAEILERLQGIKPKQGYVISPIGEVNNYLIDEFEAQYSLTLDEIERIIAGQSPAHFLTSGCKQSPWFDECKQEAACDDLSLLNRVWRKEILEIQSAGITSMEELAKTPTRDLERLVPGIHPERLSRIQLQAQSMQDGLHRIIDRIELPEAKVELYFDIESDPLRDFHYLFGLLAVTDNEEEYHLFAAESKENSEGMWKKLCEFIESHIDAPIYHYGDFERVVIEQYANKYGVSGLVREALERNLIDIQTVMRNAVIFPLSFYSLKDIAQYIGFSWRAEDASGANSVLWFEQWLQKKDPKLFQKIAQYNEDDVRATYKLQRWLRENAGL